MGAFIYFMCAVTAFVCFALLWRGWRSNRAALLFWSALCFAGLTVSNVLLVLDKLVLQSRGQAAAWYREHGAQAAE